MPFVKLTADVLKVDRIQGYQFCIQLRLHLLGELLVGVPIEESAFLAPMGMQIAIKKYFFLCRIIFDKM